VVIQDKKVTVWLGAADRPVVIMTKIFSQSVTDLTWTPDGHTLLACSSDGTVAAVRVLSYVLSPTSSLNLLPCFITLNSHRSPCVAPPAIAVQYTALFK